MRLHRTPSKLPSRIATFGFYAAPIAFIALAVYGAVSLVTFIVATATAKGDMSDFQWYMYALSAAYVIAGALLASAWHKMYLSVKRVHGRHRAPKSRHAAILTKSLDNKPENLNLEVPVRR
jgi:hypothetical protein